MMSITRFNASIFAAMFVISSAATADTVPPFSKLNQPLDANGVEFRMKSGRAAGRAVQMAFSLLNQYGLQRSIEKWIIKSEPRFKSLLTSTRLPGVLVFVEVQESNTEARHLRIVGDKPFLIGAGLTPTSTWQAWTFGDESGLMPRVAAGYRSTESESYFLWVEKNGEALAYRMTPSMFIQREARRNYADTTLREKFNTEYGGEVRRELVKRLEEQTKSVDLKKQAAELIKSRDKADKDWREINEKLAEQLRRAEAAARVSNTFQTLANVLTVAQLGMNLAAEFPDKAAEVTKATSMKDLEKIVDDITQNAKDTGALAVSAKASEKTRDGIKLQELQLLRADKVEVDAVPGAKKMP